MRNYTIAGRVFDLDNVEKPADLMASTKEEDDFFHMATEGQPSHAGFTGTGFDANGVQIPFSLGYHSVRSMKYLIEKSGFKSGRMLEIGFNLGYSARIWLHLLPDIHLTSVDISNKAETLAAANVVWTKFPDRFVFACADSKTIASKLEKNFGLAFIDGDHTEEGIIADVQVCLDLGIRTMIFDDFLPQFGMTIPALAKFPVKRFEPHGNLAIAFFD